ncbi:hypothetical protein AVEN_200921-1 [Araneus ventricosus]|uniref:Uncharacterized protein n=1 Tax=Araneus ventricosus TaxID=182803 RepID=A0A4Y2SRI9_ARAVE|nr:hypothetical protein AVEN_62532-1 [Araneus ventricosus]GBN90972.1 hypothetical protein AVEN_200921-1 [Araneus ventricosus]
MQTSPSSLSRPLWRCEYTGKPYSSRSVRRSYFHNEPTMNRGKGTNPPRTINHHLSVDNGGWEFFEALRNTPWFADLTLLMRLPGSNEPHSNTS